MTVRNVHWHEGMFLRPHHFQAAQRYSLHFINQNEKWDLHYNWGLRSIDIDLDGLANSRFVVRSLQARLHDGTLVAIPQDGSLPVLELKTRFEKATNVNISVAVTPVSRGKANVADTGRADSVRYLRDPQQLEDENTGINPQPVQVRLLNLRLMLSTQDTAGYDVLPVARI